MREAVPLAVVVRQVVPETTIARCRKHLEQATAKHLASTSEEVAPTADELPLEERMAVAYAEHPDKAPCSWVPKSAAKQKQ